MFLLTYYDDKDCLVTTLGRPFAKNKEAHQAIIRAVLKHLKHCGCQKPKALFQEAQKTGGFSCDPNSDIELRVEPCVVYIRTESAEPFFATYQIVRVGSFKSQLSSRSAWKKGSGLQT